MEKYSGNNAQKSEKGETSENREWAEGREEWGGCWESVATTSSGRESTEKQTAVSLSVGNEEKIDHKKWGLGRKYVCKFFGRKNKQTLPKALRTQALTALTSNFGLVGLVQYAW